MPLLKNILRKRDELGGAKSPDQKPIPQTIPTTPPHPDITFMRSDTFSQEIITPPSYLDHNPKTPPSTNENRPSSASRHSFQFLNRLSRSPSVSSPSPPRPRNDRRLSNLLQLENHRSHSNSRESSVNLPTNLPQIVDDGGVDKQEREAQWEKRATVLVQQSPHLGQLSSPRQSEGDLTLPNGEKSASRSSSRSQLADIKDDDVSLA